MGWREDRDTEKAERREAQKEYERHVARLGGTRQFFSQAWGEALLETLTTTGAVRASDIAIMLDRLAVRFEDYPLNCADDEWDLDLTALREESDRVRALAALYQTRARVTNDGPVAK